MVDEESRPLMTKSFQFSLKLVPFLVMIVSGYQPLRVCISSLSKFHALAKSLEIFNMHVNVSR